MCASAHTVDWTEASISSITIALFLNFLILFYFWKTKLGIFLCTFITKSCSILSSTNCAVKFISQIFSFISMSILFI